MDITYYTHTVRDTARGNTFTVRTLGPETDYAGKPAYQVDQTERTVLHLEVGDPVLVHAFGRNRPGHVTKLGRTKVTVDFQQNRQGDRGSRSAGAWDLSPVTEGPQHTRFDREVISA